MGLTLESLAAEMQPHHNEVVIVHDIYIGRLIGVADDEFDYYYMVATAGQGLGYYSAAGHCVSLRGHYPEEDYARLDNILELNNAGKTAEFELRVLPAKREFAPAANAWPEP